MTVNVKLVNSVDISPPPSSSIMHQKNQSFSNFLIQRHHATICLYQCLMADIMPQPCSPVDFFCDNASVFHVVLLGLGWGQRVYSCTPRYSFSIEEYKYSKREKIREQIETSFCHANAIQFYFSTIGLWAIPGKQSGVSKVNLPRPATRLTFFIFCSEYFLKNISQMERLAG